MSVFADVVGGVLKPIGDYFNRRQEIKASDRQQERAIKQAMTERQIQLISQGLTADMAWETEFARQAGSSWKDEFELLVLSAPLIMCFIPGLAPYVHLGFAALDKTPQWFMFLVTTVYLANYGIRAWRKTQSDT